MRHNRIYIYTIMLTLFVITTISCKRNETELLATNGKTKLVFTVQGLNTSEVSIGKLASNRTLTNQDNSSEENSLIRLNNNINLLSSSIDGSLKKQFETKKATPKIASTSSLLHDYIRYRVLIYNETTGLLEKSVQTTAGGVAEVEVTAGDNYKWYAYSYNTQDPVPEPIIENNIPSIRTVPGKEFIWDSSDEIITATQQKHAISITFKHKVAEVVLEIDKKDLYGKITDLNIELDDPEYFNTAKINLLTGEASDVEPYTSTYLGLSDFDYDFSSDSTVFRVIYYTANPRNNIENLKVNIKKLTILHDDGSSHEVQKITDPAKSVQFSFTTPQASNSHIASMKLRYKIPRKTILHVTGDGNNDDQKFSFTAQPATRDLSGSWSTDPANNRPPFNMIKAARNYGIEDNSIVYTDGFNHTRCLNDGTLDQKLALRPDIVIISLYYTIDANDITALKQYLDNGGVVIMMTDAAVPTEVSGVQSFIRELFSNLSITLATGSTYNGGTMFKLLDERVNDRILNGPFSELYGKYWGSDTHSVMLASNLPTGTATNQATIYSENNPLNRAVSGTGTPMFKHNSKSFFWIGNASFLSTPLNTSKGWSLGYTGEPFATVSISGNQQNSNTNFNYDHYPMPKRYGQDYANPVLGSIGYSFGDEVHNAPLFANLMAWALYRSEFFGINKANRIAPGSTNGSGINDWSSGTGKNGNMNW